ncbi:Orf105 [Heliothis zea nudivirus]|uniref:Orf105 n=1 Tax=Heliothis zea nudivirus 1 TaxID=3116536 RepID=Q8JKK8_9VIRU|nr:Orf105 [Heliothis zea nudivirus]AAN04399.1 Orf105 [Heliothis zea nudivirus]
MKLKLDIYSIQIHGYRQTIILHQTRCTVRLLQCISTCIIHQTPITEITKNY